MTLKEFRHALRKSRRVFVQVPCTGDALSVDRGAADDVQTFQISKSEARRVLIGLDASTNIIAAMYGEDLYIN